MSNHSPKYKVTPSLVIKDTSPEQITAPVAMDDSLNITAPKAEELVITAPTVLEFTEPETNEETVIIPTVAESNKQVKSEFSGRSLSDIVNDLNNIEVPESLEEVKTEEPEIESTQESIQQSVEEEPISTQVEISQSEEPVEYGNDKYPAEPIHSDEPLESSVIVDIPQTQEEEEEPLLPGMEESMSEKTDIQIEVSEDEIENNDLLKDIEKELDTNMKNVHHKPLSEITTEQGLENTFVVNTQQEDEPPIVETTQYAMNTPSSDEETVHISDTDVPETTSEDLTQNVETVDLSRQALIEKENSYIPSWDKPCVERAQHTVIITDEDSVEPQLAAIIPDKYTDSTDREILKYTALDNDKSFPSTLIRGANHLTDEHRRQRQIVADANPDKRGRSVKIDNVPYGDEYSSKKNFQQKELSKVVSGSAAIETVMTLISGTRRVRLYNSGFWCRIRPPKKSELHDYTRKCITAQYEFGRKFGELAFMPADVENRSAFMDLFEKLVTDSNLKDWSNKHTLRKHISFLDYDVCMWAVATLMYPEGARTTFLCNNPKCGQADEILVDVTKMRFNDYDRLPSEAIKYTCASGPDSIRTTEDLEKYHDEILKDRERLDVNEGFFIDVAVPSIDKFITTGEAYVSDIADRVALTKQLEVEAVVKNRFYRVFAPWIQQITYVHSETGKTIHVMDPVVIPDVIDSLQLADTKLKLSDVLEEYLTRKQITYFGYIYDKCPHCGTTPSSTIHGIIPCDMKFNFFTSAMDFLA